ncbi:hypothetical protein D0Z00_002221 [Geotrichum galactomycetum]|uniref:Uncharacterized protein n=1 Tax=Geotrichum galactomycetum TaxID=27317 RepID=A0ACB6V4R4_9ASCO|nr:hypothetical protein D0Z00_002221 [Geotrichum candidum]
MIPFYASLLVLLAALLQIAGPPLAVMVPGAAAEDIIHTVSSITSVQTLAQAQVTLDGPIAGSLYIGLDFDTDSSGVVAEKVKELLLVGYNSLWISVDLDNLELGHAKRMISEDQPNNSSEQVGFLRKRAVSLYSFLDNVDEFLRDTDYEIIQNVVHININLLNRDDDRVWTNTELERRVNVLNALIRGRFDENLYEHNRVQQVFNISKGIPSVDEFFSIGQKRIFFTLTSSITDPVVNATQLANHTFIIPNFARFADIKPIITADDTQGDNLVYNKSMPGCPVDRATELPGVRVSMNDTTGILALRNCGYLPLLDLNSLSFPQTEDKDDRQNILFNELQRAQFSYQDAMEP